MPRRTQVTLTRELSHAVSQRVRRTPTQGPDESDDAPTYDGG
jgi:hypothetical protein